jgi:hypothetical protein
MSFRSLLAVLCIAFSVNIYADHHTIEKSWTFSFRFENDPVADTDRHCTNGIKYSWIFPDLSSFRDSEKLPVCAKTVVRELPCSQVEDLQRDIAFSIGQCMYARGDIDTRTLIKDDRPNAGWNLPTDFGTSLI